MFDNLLKYKNKKYRLQVLKMSIISWNVNYLNKDGPYKNRFILIFRAAIKFVYLETRLPITSGANEDIPGVLMTLFHS